MFNVLNWNESPLYITVPRQAFVAEFKDKQLKIDSIAQ